MKFKEGDVVEVLRRENETPGSWFPASIISVKGNCCRVMYASLVDHQGELVTETVHQEEVRPQPPHVKVKGWMVGDVAEMFDVQCWRTGKITKVLNNNTFMVKLFGSIQLREFHKFHIRVRLAWHRNKWLVMEQAAQNKKLDRHCMQNKLASSGIRIHRARSQQDADRGSLLKVKDGRGHVEVSQNKDKIRLPARLMKRSNPHKQERSYMGECRWSASRSLGTDDSDQCSVASCSFNEFPNSPIRGCHKSLENLSDNSDAESSFPAMSGIKHLTPCFEQKVEAEIHELEFHAYRSTVLALFASGPLSWEQESLLTNLRLSLNISDEEHLLQLRQLRSAEV